MKHVIIVLDTAPTFISALPLITHPDLDPNLRMKIYQSPTLTLDSAQTVDLEHFQHHVINSGKRKVSSDILDTHVLILPESSQSSGAAKTHAPGVSKGVTLLLKNISRWV